MPVVYHLPALETIDLVVVVSEGSLLFPQRLESYVLRATHKCGLYLLHEYLTSTRERMCAKGGSEPNLPVLHCKALGAGFYNDLSSLSRTR
jgi:hypothetical protein